MTHFSLSNQFMTVVVDFSSHDIRNIKLSVAQSINDPCPKNGPAKSVWHKLRSYLDGEVVDFSDIDLSFTGATEFAVQVYTGLRQIKFGETITYGQLAQKVGRDGAARAIGGIMSRNRFPILVPCHRVLASHGIGGFSAGGGIALKKQLLAHEATKTKHLVLERES